MAESKSNGKPLRFGALIRVSDPDQEKEGESLRVQREQIEKSVGLLGGVVTAWYGGQEHATEGHERKELRRLTADARKGLFDAVILQRADRWDRGSDEAAEAKKVFKALGVPMFFGATRYDLRNPEQELLVDISGVVGKYDANNRRKVSLLSRIKRAREGRPTAGNLPFGRTWDRGPGWGLDPEKVAKVKDIARRYLAGERLRSLAREYGIAHSFLCRTLRYGCSDQWVIDFKDEALGIHEAVTLTVPRLLDDATIRRVCERLRANATYQHGGPTREYLLSGRVFCAHCGYNLHSQPHKRGKYLYYRHAVKDAGRDCPVRPRPYVRADQLEAAVLSRLLMMFGNPKELQAACKAAVPDCEALLRRKARLEAEREKVVAKRARLVDAVADGLLSKEQVRQKAADLDAAEAQLRADLDGIAEQLAGLPPEGEETPLAAFEAAWCGAFEFGKNPAAALSMEEKRRILDAIFDGVLPGGKPAGVYVTPPLEHKPHRPKTWGFTIKGRLYFEAESVSQSASRCPCGRRTRWSRSTAASGAAGAPPSRRQAGPCAAARRCRTTAPASPRRPPGRRGPPGPGCRSRRATAAPPAAAPSPARSAARTAR
jgi:site-specific DNA recombinase